MVVILKKKKSKIKQRGRGLMDIYASRAHVGAVCAASERGAPPTSRLDRPTHRLTPRRLAASPRPARQSVRRRHPTSEHVRKR